MSSVIDADIGVPGLAAHRDAFLAWMKMPESGNPYADNSIKSYGRVLAKFFAFLHEDGAESLNEVNSLVLRRFLRVSLKEGKKATASLERNVLSVFFDWAWGSGLCAGNPVRSMDNDRPHARRGGRPEKRLPEVLFEHEVADIMRLASEGRESTAMRDMAILGLLLDTGLRESELCSLSVADGRNLLRNGALRVIGKGNKERLIRPLSLNRSCLVDYLAARESAAPSEPLFRSTRNNRLSAILLYKLVRSYLDKAGVTKSQMGPHLLRHTAASLMLAEKMNLKLVQENLGHSSIKTTEVYLHLLNP